MASQFSAGRSEEMTMKVYQAIKHVAAALSSEGIGKGRRNQQQGYNFRGIDDVLNALSSALVEAGLLILPRVMNRTVTERETKNGGALFYVTVQVEFDLVSAEDGSKHTVATYGEAMDSADKATNKAMSAAYKYLALLTFCIPTEASPDNDADFTTHEVAGKQKFQHAKGNERPATTAGRVATDIKAAIRDDKPLTVVERYQAAWEDSDALGDAVWANLTSQEQDYVTDALNQAQQRRAA
jgi:hypothetical protein